MQDQMDRDWHKMYDQQQLEVINYELFKIKIEVKDLIIPSKKQLIVTEIRSLQVQKSTSNKQQI